MFKFRFSDYGTGDWWGPLWTLSCATHLKGCLPQPRCLGPSSGGREPVPHRLRVRTVPTACWGRPGWQLLGRCGPGCPLLTRGQWVLRAPAGRASLPALPLGAGPACPWGPARWPQVPAVGTPPLRPDGRLPRPRAHTRNAAALTPPLFLADTRETSGPLEKPVWGLVPPPKWVNPDLPHGDGGLLTGPGGHAPRGPATLLCNVRTPTH